MKKARPRIVGTVRTKRNPLMLAPGIGTFGRMPSRLVIVKTGSGRLFRDFVRFCAKYNIEYFKPENGWHGEEEPSPLRGHRTTYECHGLPQALDALEAMPFVIQGCFPMSNGAPHFNSSCSPRPRY